MLASPTSCWPRSTRSPWSSGKPRKPPEPLRPLTCTFHPPVALSVLPESLGGLRTASMMDRVRSSSPGQRCAYVRSVSTAEACPRTICTCLTDAPPAKRTGVRVAQRVSRSVDLGHLRRGVPERLPLPIGQRLTQRVHEQRARLPTPRFEVRGQRVDDGLADRDRPTRRLGLRRGQLTRLRSLALDPDRPPQEIDVGHLQPE